MKIPNKFVYDYELARSIYEVRGYKAMLRGARQRRAMHREIAMALIRSFDGLRARINVWKKIISIASNEVDYGAP